MAAPVQNCSSTQVEHRFPNTLRIRNTTRVKEVSTLSVQHYIIYQHTVINTRVYVNYCFPSIFPKTRKNRCSIPAKRQSPFHPQAIKYHLPSFRAHNAILFPCQNKNINLSETPGFFNTLQWES